MKGPTLYADNGIRMDPTREDILTHGFSCHTPAESWGPFRHRSLTPCCGERITVPNGPEPQSVQCKHCRRWWNAVACAPCPPRFRLIHVRWSGPRSRR